MTRLKQLLGTRFRKPCLLESARATPKLTSFSQLSLKAIALVNLETLKSGWNFNAEVNDLTYRQRRTLKINTAHNWRRFLTEKEIINLNTIYHTQDWFYSLFRVRPSSDQF